MCTAVGQLSVLAVSTMPKAGFMERLAIPVLKDRDVMSKMAVPVVSDPVPAVVGTTRVESTKRVLQHYGMLPAMRGRSV
jgi:hypothetical protein